MPIYRRPLSVLALLAVISALAIGGCAGGTGGAACPGLSAPIATAEARVVTLESADGRALLARNVSDADLGPLLEHFESQQHRAHCGVASSVIALNALGVAAGAPENLAPYRYHTQATFFDRAEVGAVVSAEQVSNQGMTLDQLGGLLDASGAEAHVSHGGDLSLDDFRSLLRANVERAGDLVLVNYHRTGVGQQGGGHISPVAAFDEVSDRALVLDVARYRYPPVWVPTPMLFEATRGTDSDSGLTRGVVEVRAR